MPSLLSHQQKLWIVKVASEPPLLEALAAQWGNEALTVTLLSPPRQATGRLELIYDRLPDMAALTAQSAIIAALRGKPAPRLICQPAPALDWLKKVAADFPPFTIDRWTIHGALHRRAVADRRYALQIDATNAFGTGEHPTTRGCLLMLSRLIKSHKELRKALDIGCGSGILGMGFIKATHGKAVAVDLDPVAVMIARHNRNANGLRSYMQIDCGNGYRARLVKRNQPYDLIMANIFARPLGLMAKDLKQHLRPGGVAILAGLLNRQAPMVINAHRQQGLHLLKRKRDGEWTILAFQRPDRA